MAPRQENRNIQKVGLQPSPSAPKDQGKWSQSIKKDRPQSSSRTSERLEELQLRQEEFQPRQEEIPARQEQTVSKDRNTEPKHPLPFLTNITLGKEFPQVEDQKRKGSRVPTGPPNPALGEPLRKRRRTSLAGAAVKDTCDQGSTSGIDDDKIDPIDYWREKGRWPEAYFKQDDQTRKDFAEDFTEDFEKDSWYEKYWIPEMDMNHLLARKKSSSSLRGKKSEASSTTPSDQKPREAKSAPYTHPSYTTVLATKGSFIGNSDLGITDASKSLCRILLEKEQTVPQDSLFRDDVFDKACQNIEDRNKARVVQDVTSAEILATYGARHLDLLIESVNEGWDSAIPFYGSRPQPDYSVGFARSAFTDDQLEKLKPFVGEVTDTFTSYFMATWQMYFPFLTCEVKCSAAALDVADRQNAHSMTIAVRGIVELFKLVKREKELHQEVLAFSISHDHRSVRIYGHYPIIDGDKTTFYRYPIHTFDFTALGGREKWTAYKFTKNVYDIWMPTHLKRICSVIDDLPADLDFEVLRQSELGDSGLSQCLESHHLSDQSSRNAAPLEEADSQSSRISSRDVTPDT